MDLCSDRVNIKGYETISLLGSGSFGKSFLAYANSEKQIVVIKVFSNDLLWYSLSSNKETLLKIDCPSILHTYHIEDYQGIKYTVQEYVSGQNLATINKKSGLSLEDFFEISLQLLNAIKYLKALGITHKDIKPENIIYNQSKKTATLIDIDLCFIDLSSSQFAGTLNYAAPEQIFYNQFSSEADLFSIGKVMSFLLFGQIEFDRNLKKWVDALHAMIINNAHFFLKNLPEELVTELTGLLVSMLDFSPDKRIDIDIAIQKIEVLFEMCRQHDLCGYMIHKSTVFSNRFDSTCYFESVLITQPVDPLNISSITPLPALVNDNCSDKSTVAENKIDEQYRKYLYREYDVLRLQASITFYLWLSCFVVYIALMVFSLVLFTREKILAGVFSTFLELTVGGFQKIFSIREDHYHDMIEQKMHHLETGDYLDYAVHLTNRLNCNDKREESREILKSIRALVTAGIGKTKDIE